MKYFIALIVVLIGVFMVLKTDWIYAFTGPIDWAEAHLGTEGGTRVLIKILGVLLILFAFFGITGFLGDIVGGIFGPLFHKAGI